MPINSILPLYDIYFFNTAGARVLLLDNYSYLELSQKLNDSWFFNIRLEFPPEDDRLDFFRNNVTPAFPTPLTRDFILEIYRTDPLLNTKELVFEGFHRTLVDQIRQTGAVIITLYGTGYSNLLKRRIVIPPVDEETSSKSGVAETIMKAFVSEQAISPVDSARIIPGLTNEPNSSAGENAEYSARYTNLYTVLSRIAEQGEVDFGIVRNTTVGTFEFQVRSLWGTDRTIGNVAGIPPTIFDITLNNMTIPIFTLNGNDEVNYVYVGGQGVGINRIIETFSNPTAILVSPWNRHEEFVDARNESTSDGRETRGNAYLKEHEVKADLTFNIEETDGTRWLTNWTLGDLVTARYGNNTFTKKIVKVTAVVSAGRTGQSQIEVVSAELQNVE